jgi:hypothetical protein
MLVAVHERRLQMMDLQQFCSEVIEERQQRGTEMIVAKRPT